MNDNIVRDFYSRLQFPGHYTTKDIEFYLKEGVGHNRYLADVDQLLPNRPQVLDIGCGTGLVTNLFASRYPTHQFTAIDFSDSIDFAKKFSEQNKIKNVDFVKSNIISWSCEKKFDLIICLGVLHHIPRYEKALDRIMTLMADQGLLVLSLYNPWGKILKKFTRINYLSEILEKDQEQNPFELSFTKNQVLDLCGSLELKSATPSINNQFVDLLAMFNSRNGGLVSYVFSR
jgi:trans-aconitate methyltransferase